ncbi:uncharacterized protein K452DRAFT_265751 [Aplosporella prunicola CBS 121167]|uniref:Homeobox domain-containing protein n=1 Tax=Aplosporella prunicola CBS 121167 TaxID=1176127 RepID=A0A6A6BPB7_9PEZI|nr:uncharacterized protein K452DRAFT_265751 [Aplosporella prunicola CBS 121167]KAF2145115.1 hypothetical protein K452DRAFT_265751 [Aplosporella prunicola CBS 121167]
MVNGNHSVPLSPPSSPRMSAFTNPHAESEWHSQRARLEGGFCGQPDSNMTLMHSDVSGLPLDAQKRPLLRTHRSVPYPLRQEFTQQANAPSSHPIMSPAPNRERITISNIEGIEPSNVTFGGSAPASPVSRLTPSPSGERADGDEHHDDGEIVGSNDEGDEQRPMTAAELRAQKRKMKRFRLTHNQTRFLMSEFARQAHPDAAHRERLAREIPGLTPRQVQVWFQNRRAKLKRLTSDDRERVMKSRALPDDFDMTQALHSPFGSSHGVGTPLASPASFQPSFPEGNMIRPLSLDTLRRLPEAPQISPSGITSSFGGFSFTPPQSATDTSSPVSASGEPSPYSYSSQPLNQSPQRANPFATSVPTTSGFTSNPQIPRLQLHDMIGGRTRAETICSPLRTSMSYSNDGTLSQSSPYSTQSMEGSAISDQHLPRSGMPYSLGYSYPQMPGFQSGAATRMRSFSSTVPRRIELSQHSAHYNAPPRSNTNPHSATFPTYQTSPLSAPGPYNTSMMSAPHQVSSFNSNYLRHDSGQAEQYPPMGSVIGEVHSPTRQNDSSSGNDVQMQQY